MGILKKIFAKTKREFLVPCALCIIACALCPVSYALSDDDFAFDEMEFFDGPIEDSGPLELDMSTPLILNENTSFFDVRNKDIAGVWLGMPFEEAHVLFYKVKSLYAPRKRNSIIYSIPTDWKYNLDYECRQQKIVVPSLLEKCVNSLAKKRGLLYASEMHLVRDSTGETVTVYFTSNAMDNIAWRVIYQNDADEQEGAAEKFANQWEKKILAFWKGVLEKYGAPNSGDDKWITSDNAFDPMMTAFFGRLELTDAGLDARDRAENYRLSRENFRAKPYSF